ncbi:hypothetical protein B0T26DRAFT_637358 [Lasiosphaeria miniovina]|uniref:Cupin type-2 domain-containing protein n=1 Tax=Lasiosphaeria miniovina TaxID=1954250 RepID=A0AA40B3G7_9PEZI|nr:uncharacterized protein B0T26DRAFT_637358 [Lasiosphaeria miniovina]KAK0726818.1 hypothetical protein B0T26DRAFT_637358 [Lasiosphaeria miniovina]
MADSKSTPEDPPPAPHRYTTTHDAVSGKSIFSPSLPETVGGYGSIGMQVFDSYKTFSSPLDMSDDADIAALKSDVARASDVAPSSVWFPAPGESLLRYCDWAPGATLDLHRTETIDFGVVLQGAMELTLDSGEVRVLRVGDTIVQRGTLHSWRNPSDTVWARVIFFLLGTPPVRVDGEEKTEHLPWKN